MVVVHRQSHDLWCCGQCSIIELNASILEHCEHSKVGQDGQCFLGLILGDGWLDPLRDPIRIRPSKCGRLASSRMAGQYHLLRYR